ncbi:PDZ DHR GLGF domain-containing-like protein [Schistosoma japonicum]|nr:PDZ DHR GLGF domain-containing-like protein [Schistosoma japonicum]KAH8861817.1 PDZ DHR GLGF domain-containing-like protein [Schistosoma japonicum]
MMPTTRQPIKAKHMLQNENISESKETIHTGNEHVSDVISSTDDIRTWRLPKYDVKESRRSIASSQNDPCSYQRITIFTNPDAQRRLSTDSITLERQSVVEDLNWNNDIPTPAKRQYTDHSFVTSKLDLSDGNNDSSERSSDNSNNNLLPSDYLSSMNTSNINSCSSSSVPFKKQIIFLKKRNRWSIDISKRSTTRRSSTGSLKVEIQKVTNNHNVNDTIYETNLERSNIFKGIRRSARRTFSNLCSMLRYSNTNLTTVYNESNIHDNQLSSDRNPCNQSSTDLLPSLLSCELNELVKESVYDKSKLQHSNSVVSSNLRFVTLSRPDVNEPFGLFVIQSEQGYRITRLSERFIQNNVTNEISIGDVIIQVNSIDSINYTIYELQELFQKSLSLLLTIIHHS